MTSAPFPEEMEPLLALCRAGKLFEVMDWVKTGKPVALPQGVRGTQRYPLRVAMERGFHSLVQVLLQAGTPCVVGNYNALEHAVDLRRADLASLLVQHGARVTDVAMSRVLETWDPEIVELFLAHGASLTEGKPVAWALIHKVRPALGLLKRFGPTDPDVMAQAACALRHHAYDGNVKWVSLLLWAGADPRLSGSADPSHDEDCFNAIEWAVMAGKLDVLRLKKMVTMSASDRPECARLLEHCRSSEVLELLMAEGHLPDKLADRGTRAIESLVSSVSWCSYGVSSYLLRTDRARTNLDSSEARDRIKMVHMLVARGGRWLPTDKHVIGYLRRSLLMMTRDYLLEFAWLMHRYRAARRRDVEELFRTPSVARLLGDNLSRAEQMISELPNDIP